MYQPEQVVLSYETHSSLVSEVVSLKSRLFDISHHFKDYPYERLYAYLFEAITGLPLSNFTAAIEATNGEIDGFCNIESDPRLSLTDYATYVKYSQPQF